jgi:hypothetical protein
VLAFFLSGWTVLPFYCMNQAGIAVSYYYSLFLAIIPVLVTGGLYIAGAYARRNKAIRQQKIAELGAKAEDIPFLRSFLICEPFLHLFHSNCWSGS